MKEGSGLKVLRKRQRDRLNGRVSRWPGETDEGYNARRAEILQKERQALTRQLMILEHIAYIIECVALRYTGEAKTEIGALIKILEEIEQPAEARWYEDARHRLGEVKDCLYDSDVPGAAGLLSSISRLLWNRTLPPDAL